MVELLRHRQTKEAATAMFYLTPTAPHLDSTKSATLTARRSLPVYPGWSQPVDATLYLEGEMECGLMGHKFHRGFTAAEKTELWDRWKRGESLKAIGRAFGKQSSSIYFLVAPHGGIRPAQRCRSRLALTLAEREVISRGVTADQSARSIARLLGRSPSTVSREMSRNGGCDRYRAGLADENAWARARRPQCCKLANSPRLRRAVAGKLRLDWSPEQIAGWLKRTHPEDECNQVSHETIYRSLFAQTRGVLKKLFGHLRSKRSMRRSQPVDPNGDRRGISRISSQSVSDRRRLKIGRCLAIGKAICCPGRTTAISRHWSSVIRVT
jgi:DNA-binding CsgD family transcriptional regulator